jgi:hypothetical protein
LPIYWGNPCIERHFNTRSFVNAHNVLKSNSSNVVRFLEANCQREFAYAGGNRKSFLGTKIRRKLKTAGQAVKTRLQYEANFTQLIEKIIEIDRDDSLYARYLSEPWFHNNKPPSNEQVVQRWREIFG